MGFRHESVRVDIVILPHLATGPISGNLRSIKAERSHRPNISGGMELEIRVDV